MEGVWRVCGGGVEGCGGGVRGECQGRVRAG